MQEAVAVLDVGKTHTKLALVAASGQALATRARVNTASRSGQLRFLDADDIETWMIATLRELSRLAEIRAIVPVGHGAAAALVADEALATPVVDYESEPPEDVARAYRALRDPFSETMSPALPASLNLGLQFFWQEKRNPELFRKDVHILLWPQYWAWRLSGAMASEVTSLGCHSDLWKPYQGDFSDLAKSRGWSAKFPSLCRASDVLDRIRPSVASETGIARTCEILCGVHDSNAALWSARAVEALGARFSLVSTGTWFVAFCVGGSGKPKLDPERDTLCNVGIDGKPVPSARFMGGREYAAIVGDALNVVASPSELSRAVARGLATQPSFIKGSGPFPNSEGKVLGDVRTVEERASLASLHLALMTDASLELLVPEGPVLIEGRFAQDRVFASALASLGREVKVLCGPDLGGVALGAARIFWPRISRISAEPVQPLSFDLSALKGAWSHLWASATAGG